MRTPDFHLIMFLLGMILGAAVATACSLYAPSDNTPRGYVIPHVETLPYFKDTTQADSTKRDTI